MALSPIEKFAALQYEGEFLFLVVYRGSWCPFCIAYLHSLQSLAPDITKAGGIPLILTSEKEQYLDASRSASGYSGEAIVDPANDLVKELATRHGVDIVVSKRRGYEAGMAQPAILVVKKDGTVLEKWAVNPALMNLGGAKDRPLLDQVWSKVEARLQGKNVADAPYSTMGIVGFIRQKLGAGS